MSLVWNTTDCYNKSITWYSSEVIDRIKNHLKGENSQTALEVLKIIEEAEKCSI